MIRSEKYLFMFHLMALACLTAIATFAGRYPAWPSQYTPLLIVSFGLLVGAVTLRQFRILPRVALTLIALCHFVFLVMIITVINGALLPVGGIANDLWLIRIDSMVFGYVWKGYVAYFAQYPLLVEALRIVYVSAFSMLFLTVLTLGLTGATHRLQNMVWTAAIAGALTLTIWALFPTFGPTVEYGAPTAELVNARLLVNVDYGRILREFAFKGIQGDANSTLGGLIAFPSFHMVMALIAAWFSRKNWIGVLIIPLAVLMGPATLLHGGHHLIDLIGGVVVFGAALALARLVVRASFATHSTENSQAAH